MVFFYGCIHAVSYTYCVLYILCTQTTHTIPYTVHFLVYVKAPVRLTCNLWFYMPGQFPHIIKQCMLPCNPYTKTKNGEQSRKELMDDYCVSSPNTAWKRLMHSPHDSKNKSGFNCQHLKRSQGNKSWSSLFVHFNRFRNDCLFMLQPGRKIKQEVLAKILPW